MEYRACRRGFLPWAPWLSPRCRLRQTYGGRDATLKRLRRIMSVGDALFILSAALMLENNYHVLMPLFVKYIPDGYYHYVTYIHNNWVIILLVAAIIEIYTTHRISHEPEKKNMPGTDE